MSFDDSEYRDGPLRAKPYGASTATISIAIVVIVLALGVAGTILIVNRGSGDDQDSAALVQTPTQSEQPVIISSPTGSVDANSPTLTLTTPTPPVSEVVTPTPQPPTATETATEVVAPEPTTEPATATTTTAPTETLPEATATPKPVDNTPTPAATEAPLIGDFGELPPGQLPSGGVASTLQLSYQLGMSLDSLPTTATVYQLEWPVLSSDQVSALATRLGLIGPIDEQGVGVYNIASDRGTLYVSPTEMNFRAAGFETGDALPSDDEAINTAFKWLDLSGFIGSNVDSGTIRARDEDSGKVIVGFRLATPSPVLAPTPSATIAVGTSNTVLEAQVHWPEELYSSDYGLKSPLDMWQAAQSGSGFLEADISTLSASGSLTGTATMTDFSIAYTLAGNSADNQYLVPVLAFHGTARIDQSGEEIPVIVSVPAIFGESGSSG